LHRHDCRVTGGGHTRRLRRGRIALLLLAVVTTSGSESSRPKLWAPAPGTPWDWQLKVPVDTSVDVLVYDIDGFENGADVVREPRREGRRVICCINVGAAESFRPDYRLFPREVVGKGNGWEGERWLDIRRIDVLGHVMARASTCAAPKGSTRSSRPGGRARLRHRLPAHGG